MPIWRTVLSRYLRLAPMYYFMIFFMWKFLMLFGGKGPRFYQYEDNHSCSETWFWHFTFLNNMFPWKQSSNCLQETWYLANDLQFFAVLCFLVSIYQQQKKKFYMVILLIFLVCAIWQIIVISHNTLSASFLTNEDEYWTLYHFKPFNRIQGYLIGVCLGCEYYSFKYGPALTLTT